MTSSRSFKNGRWFVDGTNQLRDRFTVLFFSRLIAWLWSTISSHIGQSNGWTEVRKAPISSCVLGKGSRFSQQLCKNQVFTAPKPGFLQGISELSTCGVWLVTAVRKSLAAVGSASLRCLGTAAPWRILVSRTGDWWVWWVVISVCVYLQRVVIICDYHWLLIIIIMVTFAKKTWQIIGLPKGPIVVWFLLCCFALCRDGFILVVSTTLAKDRVGMLLIHYEGYN